MDHYIRSLERRISIGDREAEGELCRIKNKLVLTEPVEHTTRFAGIVGRLKVVRLLTRSSKITIQGGTGIRICGWCGARFGRAADLTTDEVTKWPCDPCSLLSPFERGL